MIRGLLRFRDAIRRALGCLCHAVNVVGNFACSLGSFGYRPRHFIRGSALFFHRGGDHA